MKRNIEFFISDKIQVRNSKGKGRGVFATADIKEGETLEVSPAVYIPVTETDMVRATVLASYAFAPGDEDKGMAIGLGYSSLYNHSEDSSADFFASDKMIIIKATRKIEKGEEIFLNYGWEDDDYYWDK